MSKPIEVWHFHEAPQRLRDALYDNGGDEDWLAIIPPRDVLDHGLYPIWLDSSAFGCCCINLYAVDQDGTLLIKRGWDDERDCVRWDWLHDRPKFPEYAGYELRVGCHA